MNSLKELFEMQFQLNEYTLDKCGVFDSYKSICADPNTGPNSLTNEWLRKYTAALKDEVRELEEEFLWKWWSKDNLDMQNIRVELIDILHFWISLCQVAGMNAEDVVRIYKQKNEVNIKRQLTNYSKSNKTEDDNKEIR